MSGRSITASDDEAKSREYAIDMMIGIAIVLIPAFVVIFCLLWAAGIVGDSSLASRLTSIGGDFFGLGIIAVFRKVAIDRLARKRGKAIVPLEFREVGGNHPPEGSIVSHLSVDLDTKACEYEIVSHSGLPDKGSATITSSLHSGDRWLAVIPTPSTEDGTITLTLREKNKRPWTTDPFRMETPTVIARHTQRTQ